MSSYQRYQPYNRNGRGGRGGYSQSRSFNDINFVYEENPSFHDLRPFEKSFYQEHPETSKLTDRDIDAFRKENQMTLEGRDIPRPIMNFDHTQWPSVITKLFKEKGFDKPTPIQSQGWPMALTGRNLIGIAQTGSGKTLSFMLPALLHIMGQPPIQKGEGPNALVLAPTRELACQIKEVAEAYGKVLGIRNSCLYGGASKGPQIGELQRTPHIVIATPGRLLDMLQMGKTTLKNVTYLVLDEADRMLDMGFEKDLRQILGQIRPDRQLLMWSATWPKVVQRLARDFLSDDHIKVQIGSSKLQANKAIKQIVKIVSDYDKERILCDLLVEIWNQIPGDEKTKVMERTIVFSNKKHTCERLLSTLWDQNWSPVTIHGDKTQQERDRALNDFKSGRTPILIATDVAARGLDVKEVKYVINYDFPGNIEEFVHRIGRTARGHSCEGTAYTFFTSQKQDKANASALVELMKDAGQEVPEELERMAFQSRKPAGNQSRWGSRGGRGRQSNGRGGGHFRRF
jgi:ATP-dependent RNA helicase DDX5/DBP2